MSDSGFPKSCYDKILDQHKKLRAMLDKLKRVLFERDVSYSEVVRQLEELGEMVETHFQTEEASGCFGDVVNYAPRVADKVQTLIAEHHDLSDEIKELVVWVRDREGVSEEWDELSARFTEFCEKLMQHETIENELLQEVFTEDIGSKD